MNLFGVRARSVLVAAALFCGAAQAQGLHDLPANPVPHILPAENRIPSKIYGVTDTPPGEAMDPQLHPRDQEDGKFQVVPAVQQAMLFTGIMHAFRYATQKETQDSAYGKFLPSYGQSMSELRGWDDSDSFSTSYMLHPMEGAVFGYMQVQNDPRYRDVEFGDGRDYWVSRLRALAFSAALSTQWTMGPVSEASLGNVQLHDSPGFVDLVTTPTMGLLWMMGEDALDRYAIRGMENRYSNPVVLMLARSCLSPTRSWANILAFRAPWYRDARMGIFGANRATREELLSEYREGLIEAPFGRSGYRRRTPSPDSSTFPLEAPIELTTSAHYESFLGGGSCVGGGGSGAVRVNAQLQIVAEGSGCLILHQPASNESGDSETFAAGPRWTPRAAHRVSPYAQVLVGGRRVTHEIDNLALYAKLEKDYDSGVTSRIPLRSQWQVEHQETGVALAAGGGVDYVVNRAFAWRVANVEYTHTWVGDVDNIRPENGLKLTSSVVLRIGTW